jgi:hypothetical protein
VRSDLNVADGADVTGSNVSYDTERVDGWNASTIRYNANEGATFTDADAGSMAYYDKAVNTHLSDITSIMGGKVTTSKIQSSSGSYFDLSGADIYLNQIGKLMFARTDHYIAGGVSSGIYTVINDSYDFTIMFTSSYNKIKVTKTEVYPSTHKAWEFGRTDKRWNWVHCAAISTATQTFYDIVDDLEVLHNIKPDENGKIDLMSLPKYITTYDHQKCKIKEDNGELLTDDDIDEILNDKDDIGGYVGINLGELVSLVEGSIRQLDRESSDLILQLANWVNSNSKKLDTLEKENVALKQKLLLLESKITQDINS